jgi:signal transduction histidine kinase
MNEALLFNMRILVVDDEPMNLVLLSEIIEEAGFTTVQTTTDPREVSTLLTEYRPDLLLLDLMMPHLDGFAVMEQLRGTLPADAFLPVLVLTADANPGTKRRALAAGATDFLTKPFDQNEVILRIKNLLRTRLLHTQLQAHNAALNDVVAERTACLEQTLTELKATQRRAIQHERLAALGTMAAGVGHDFRNTLMAVLGYTELLLHSIHTVDRDVAAKQLRIVYTAAEDSAKIVDRLRQFYRPLDETETRTEIDLNDLIEQVATLTLPKWKTQPMAAGAPIELVMVPGEIARISGNVAELREVLTNLIFNAVDAMPDGGTLTLRTYEKNGRVILEVTDTGIGMDEVVRQHCLEPFFTTKGANGTGLGLAMVYGIIQRHSGAVELESQPQVGTTFTLSFPVAGLVTNQTPETKATIGRPLRVLVVDDEPVLCQLLFEYLKSDWHTVETATSATQALEKFRLGSFDLVITDRLMPEMSGDDLAAAIKAMAPQQPVVMVTGFVNDDELSDSGGNIVLSKPISLLSLRQAITSAIAA